MDEIALEGGLARRHGARRPRPVRAHRRLRRGRRRLVRRAGRRGAPAFVGLALEKVGDLRYGENPHQRGALYRGRAGAGPLGGARGTAGQGDVVQQLAGRRGRRVAGRGAPRARVRDRQAQQPVRGGRAGHPRRVVPARVRRATRCQRVRRHRGVPRRRADGAAAEAMREVFTEVVVAPGVRRPRRSRPSRSATNLRRASRAPLPDGAGSTSGRCREVRWSRIATW